MLLLYFLLWGFCAHSQNIDGMVTGLNGRLSGAVVENLRTQDKRISNGIGGFNIKAENGDTLITTMLYYKNDTVIYNKQAYLIIQLKQTVRVLKEVKIVDSLSNPLHKYEQNKKDYKDIFWKGDDSKIVSVPLVLGPELGINLNIDKFYSLVSKQGNDARRLQHTLYRDYHNDVVDQRFNKTLVGQITGYKGKKLDDFIVKYRPAYEFVIKTSNYDMIKYIKKKMAEESKG